MARRATEIEILAAENVPAVKDTPDCIPAITLDGIAQAAARVAWTRRMERLLCPDELRDWRE